MICFQIGKALMIPIRTHWRWGVTRFSSIIRKRITTEILGLGEDLISPSTMSISFKHIKILVIGFLSAQDTNQSKTLFSGIQKNFILFFPFSTLKM